MTVKWPSSDVNGLPAIRQSVVGFIVVVGKPLLAEAEMILFRFVLGDEIIKMLISPSGRHCCSAMPVQQCIVAGVLLPPFEVFDHLICPQGKIAATMCSSIAPKAAMLRRLTADCLDCLTAEQNSATNKLLSRVFHFRRLHQSPQAPLALKAYS